MVSVRLGFVFLASLPLLLSSLAPRGSTGGRAAARNGPRSQPPPKTHVHTTRYDVSAASGSPAPTNPPPLPSPMAAVRFVSPAAAGPANPPPAFASATNALARLRARASLTACGSSGVYVHAKIRLDKLNRHMRRDRETRQLIGAILRREHHHHHLTPGWRKRDHAGARLDQRLLRPSGRPRRPARAPRLQLQLLQAREQPLRVLGPESAVDACRAQTQRRGQNEARRAESGTCACCFAAHQETHPQGN